MGGMGYGRFGARGVAGEVQYEGLRGSGCGVMRAICCSMALLKSRKRLNEKFYAR